MSVDMIGVLLFGGLLGFIAGVLVGAIIMLVANERGIKLPW